MIFLSSRLLAHPVCKPDTSDTQERTTLSSHAAKASLTRVTASCPTKFVYGAISFTAAAIASKCSAWVLMRATTSGSVVTCPSHRYVQVMGVKIYAVGQMTCNEELRQTLALFQRI